MFVKNNLYCDFSLITTLLIVKLFIVSANSEIKGCIFLDTVPNSTSPILAVPATVLSPSGAKKIRSPPISWILYPERQPMFFATGITTGVPFISCSLNILFLQNIKSSLRKLFNPTIWSDKVIEPEPVPLKVVGSNNVL